MSDRLLAAFSHSREASKSFNYFVAGGSATLCTYLVQQWRPTPIGSNPETIELLSIILLGFSVAYSFRLLEKEVFILKTNTTALHAANQRDVYSQALQSGGPVQTSMGIMGPSELEKNMAFYSFQKKECDEFVDEANEAYSFAHRWRTYLLFVGVIAFFVSRIARAYV